MFACPRNKAGWIENHLSNFDQQKEIADVVLYGDSIIKNFGNSWKKLFGKNCINFGFGGDRVENVLYRLLNGRIPIHIKIVIVHVGTNNLSSHHAIPQKIADGIHQICKTINIFRADVDIIVTGILPGKGRDLNKVCKVNQHLRRILIGNKFRTFYIPPNIQEMDN